MLHVAEIITRLNQPGALPLACRSTGIAYAQLWRLARGRTPNPTYKTIVALSKHFGANDEQL